MLLQVKDCTQIFIKFNAGKGFLTFLSSSRHPFKGHEISYIKAILWSFEKERLLSDTPYRSLFLKKVSKDLCFFIVVHGYAPKVSARHRKNSFSSSVTFMWTSGFFIDMKMRILIEGDRNFETYLKENYAIALDSFYLDWTIKTIRLLSPDPGFPIKFGRGFII